MTRCRVNTSVIVGTQHDKIGTRPRIGMRRETAGIGVCAITKIPVVTREAWSSSIENSRTARSDSRKRHKVNPRRRLDKHKTTSRCFDIVRIRSRQDNSVYSWTSEGMRQRTSYRKVNITKIPCERIRRRTTYNTCYVERDRATSTCSHGSDSNAVSRK